MQDRRPPDWRDFHEWQLSRTYVRMPVRDVMRGLEGSDTTFGGANRSCRPRDPRIHTSFSSAHFPAGTAFALNPARALISGQRPRTTSWRQTILASTSHEPMVGAKGDLPRHQPLVHRGR